MNKEKYMIDLFPFIVKAMASALQNPEKVWVKATPGGKLIAYSKLNDFTKDQKKEFVYNLVLIHGLHESTQFSSISYKKQGGRNELSFNFDLAFKTDEQKEEYIEFRKWVTGINSTSTLLDEVLA
jgi:hypothetical protein